MPLEPSPRPLTTTFAALPQPPVSWGAIWAGAVVSVAASVVLTVAAAGVGYGVGPAGLATRGSLSSFTPIAGAAAILVQVLAAALGGYVAGRLRTVWAGVHSDEAHFRDTAHGLIAWAVATLAGLVLGALVLAPYAEALAAAPAATTAPTAAEVERAAHIASQSALFLAVGMLLSAFTAAVAARIGGLRHEDMHGRAVA